MRTMELFLCNDLEKKIRPVEYNEFISNKNIFKAYKFIKLKYLYWDLNLRF